MGTVFNPLQKEREWDCGGGHEPQGNVKEEKQVPATHRTSEEKEKVPGTGWLAGLGHKDVRKQRVPGNQSKGRPDTVGWEAAAQRGCLGPRKWVSVQKKLDVHLGGLREGVLITQQIYPRKHENAFGRVGHRGHLAWTWTSRSSPMGRQPRLPTEEPSRVVTENALRYRDLRA